MQVDAAHGAAQTPPPPHQAMASINLDRKLTGQSDPYSKLILPIGPLFGSRLGNAFAYNAKAEIFAASGATAPPLPPFKILKTQTG